LIPQDVSPLCTLQPFLQLAPVTQELISFTARKLRRATLWQRQLLLLLLLQQHLLQGQRLQWLMLALALLLLQRANASLLLGTTTPAAAAALNRLLSCCIKKSWSKLRGCRSIARGAMLAVCC
jgi:hypothetical protein